MDDRLDAAAFQVPAARKNRPEAYDPLGQQVWLNHVKDAMGIWNHRKRDGSPRTSGTAALPGSRGMENLPHSVGIETKGGTFTSLIRKGMPLPVQVTENFTTAEPDQSSIKIRCFQGEKPRTARNRELGWFELAEIPPGGPGEPQIEVTFHVNASGAFSITAREARTGRDLPVRQC